jgi:hypothetical protein
MGNKTLKEKPQGTALVCQVEDDRIQVLLSPEIQRFSIVCYRRHITAGERRAITVLKQHLREEIANNLMNDRQRIQRQLSRHSPNLVPVPHLIATQYIITCYTDHQTRV